MFCIASQLSGDLPRVLDRRNAISGVTLLCPFSKRVNVDGDTFSLAATVRELTSSGSSYR